MVDFYREPLTILHRNFVPNLPACYLYLWKIIYNCLIVLLVKPLNMFKLSLPVPEISRAWDFVSWAPSVVVITINKMLKKLQRCNCVNYGPKTGITVLGLGVDIKTIRPDACEVAFVGILTMLHRNFVPNSPVTICEKFFTIIWYFSYPYYFSCAKYIPRQWHITALKINICYLLAGRSG